jgi:hypothetical protein
MVDSNSKGTTWFGWLCCVPCSTILTTLSVVREARLVMPHDRLEQMTRHRTCAAQEAAEHWHEDSALERYEDISSQLDRNMVVSPASLYRDPKTLRTSIQAVLQRVPSVFVVSQR